MESFTELADAMLPVYNIIVKIFVGTISTIFPRLVYIFGPVVEFLWNWLSLNLKVVGCLFMSGGDLEGEDVPIQCKNIFNNNM